MELYKPEHLEEALKIKREVDTTILAGGTDIMVKLRRPSQVIPEIKKDLLYIGHLKELKGITVNDEIIRIGAATTFDELETSESTPSILKMAIKELACISIKNIATIGGNIANASPAGDAISPLVALDGYVVLRNLKGTRRLPVSQFIVSPGKTLLESDEIIEAIEIINCKFNKEFYRKIGTRRSNALSKVNFVGLALVERDTLMNIRIVFGAVASTIVRDEKIEKTLKNKKIKELKSSINDILEQYAEKIRPIDDQRSTAIYRKNVALNLLKTFLLNL
jgi:CO/xanthine dehydrogenase FAD-binding subunit